MMYVCMYVLVRTPHHSLQNLTFVSLRKKDLPYFRRASGGTGERAAGPSLPRTGGPIHGRMDAVRNVYAYTILCMYVCMYTNRFVVCHDRDVPSAGRFEHYTSRPGERLKMKQEIFSQEH